MEGEIILRQTVERLNEGKCCAQDDRWTARLSRLSERVERGIYALTPSGTVALQTYVGRFAAPLILIRSQVATSV